MLNADESSEDVLRIFQTNVETPIYTTLSISTNNEVIEIGTRPFGEDVIESTAEVETFPRGTSPGQILDDSQFYTPLDPIDELSNIESFPQRDRIIENLLNDGLFIGGQETPPSTYFYASGANVTVQNPEDADKPEEIAQSIRLAELEGGGNIRFSEVKNSQGIEGFFTPSGQTKEKPFSLKASNTVGRKANLNNIVNTNSGKIQEIGITDPVILRVEARQFGAEELRSFFEGDVMERIGKEGVFEKIYFDARDGVVLVDPTGVSVIELFNN
ncbi:MAG: hypothetical protein ACFCAD_11330 [Pleurocapsa sp.]